ncbi:hypothetical protein CHS0354_023703 [Potamilus streckersoni]|uniref:GTP cyclohydrolase 1 n=1 Tax=Potamilus streckersoni TaxID=2493646 RepID=A0AAE0RZ72_9BIVA|nr:hypothetical protein CHS0354_023703 [Potamilus streckersoni]
MSDFIKLKFMKQKETSSHTEENDSKTMVTHNGYISDPQLGNEIAEYLNSLGVATPRVFSTITNEERSRRIESAFKEIMTCLDLDLSDDSLKDTPARIAKMYMDEVFYGLHTKNFPKCTSVENKIAYSELIVERSINVQSICEHHFLPINGFAHVGYIPKQKVIGLSKINRIVDYFSRRPQIQERLTEQIFYTLKYILQTEDVAIVIKSVHFCVKSRGAEDANPILINGLKRLEYRGYDSSGICTISDSNKLLIHKTKGKVSELELMISKQSSGSIGIGHTRWATHGAPNNVNAHPHLSNSKKIAIVHNGIIENYRTLKLQLIDKGYTFLSETDSEVLVNLIEEISKKTHSDIETSVRLALREVIGAYGISVISSDEPNKIIVAKNGSPIVIGIGDNEKYISSDATSIAPHVKRVIYLSNSEIATVTATDVIVKSIENVFIPKEIEELSFSIEQIEKGGFPHFMIKEIFEQPESIQNTIRGRIYFENGSGRIQLGGLADYLDRLASAKRFIFCACGTSWHASLVGEYLFEHFTRIPVCVEYASEFRYRNPIIYKDDIVFFISQSGETADTLAALKEAKSKGALTIGICNVVGSSISRETECGVYIHAGPEIGVASTKAFTSQVITLSLIALAIASKRGEISTKLITEYLHELNSIPKKIQNLLSQNSIMQEIAKEFNNASNFLYLGRGFNFPVALEGALKLKEISYIHAEGYPAAELKHGPIALIDEFMPVVFIAIKDSLYPKIISNIEEIKARGGRIIAIASEGDTNIESLAEYVIRVPQIIDFFSPVLTSIPLQLLAYYIAVLRGCDVDQPRNLAKSVTVE